MQTTIAEYIRDDLRARIQAGHAPVELTLQALSRTYDVSITPVRQALQALVDEQYFIKHSNGRLTVNRKRIGSRRDALSRPRPDRSRWKDQLIQDILRRSLKDSDEFLREEATAQRYGVGRTALRQFLSELAGAGFVEHLPRRGWRVRSFDERDMNDYLSVRVALEVQALDQARPRLERTSLERLLEANRPDRRGRHERLDNSLHAYLIRCAGNPYIGEFFETFGRYYAAVFEYAAPETRVVREMARQHREILTALLAEDWSAARRALRSHIRAQGPIVRQLLEQLRDD